MKAIVFEMLDNKSMKSIRGGVKTQTNQVNVQPKEKSREKEIIKAK